MCPAATEYDTGHVTAVGSTNGVINKGCPIGNPLKYDLGVCRSSHDHAGYQNTINQMTHTGPAGKVGLADRLKLFNTWVGSLAENIIDARIVKDQPASWTQAQKDADNCNNPIAWWYIDNAVSSRGHYTNFLNCKFDTLGAGIKTYSATVQSLVNGTFQNVTVQRDRITQFLSQAGSCRNVPFNMAQVRSAIGFSNVPASKIRPPCAGVVDM